MAIPVDGSAAGPSSSGLTVLLDAIRARRFSQLADILDSLELEVILRFFAFLGFCRLIGGFGFS